MKRAMPPEPKAQLFGNKQRLIAAKDAKNWNVGLRIGDALDLSSKQDREREIEGGASAAVRPTVSVLTGILFGLASAAHKRYRCVGCRLTPTVRKNCPPSSAKFKGNIMRKAETRVLTAHVPITLAEKVDQLADRLERSRGWIMKQALSSWIAQEEERDRLTHEALADVDAGCIIDHQAVLAWAESLGSDQPLPVPR